MSQSKPSNYQELIKFYSHLPSGLHFSYDNVPSSHSLPANLPQPNPNLRRKSTTTVRFLHPRLQTVKMQPRWSTHQIPIPINLTASLLRPHRIRTLLQRPRSHPSQSPLLRVLQHQENQLPRSYNHDQRPRFMDSLPFKKLHLSQPIQFSKFRIFFAENFQFHSCELL